MTGRAGRADAGQTSVELLGVLPLLVVVFLGVLQLVFAAATVQATTTAARAAARAVSQGEPDALASARAAMPGWLSDQVTVQLEGGAEPGVAVTTTIPLVLPGLDSSTTVTRRAWFPRGESPWG